MRSSADDVDVDSAENLAALLDLGPFQPHDERHVEADLFVRRGADASAMVVQRMMPPKMLTSTAFTFLSASRMRNASVTCSVVGAAADVEEVGRLAAVQLDEVHRAHRQAGAVHQAADVAVEVARSSAPPRRRGLRRDPLREVSRSLEDVLVTEEGVVVEVDLRVQRHQLALPR